MASTRQNQVGVIPITANGDYSLDGVDTDGPFLDGDYHVQVDGTFDSAGTLKPQTKLHSDAEWSDALKASDLTALEITAPGTYEISIVGFLNINAASLGASANLNVYILRKKNK